VVWLIGFFFLSLHNLTSRLFLVDLGGSEKLKKSQAANSIDRTKEAININLGLLALKQCAEALNSDHKKRYIPFADSKLTMLLSAGLGGNSKTCVVICATQDPDHAKETLSTVAFGRAISKVSNESKIGEDEAMLQSLLQQIDTDIDQCEIKIRENERWETSEQRTLDVYGEVEIRETSVLVGAESHRFKLEKLLDKRAGLTGTTIDRVKENSILGFGNAHEYNMGQKFVAS
jgi:hypothetical protein